VKRNQQKNQRHNFLSSSASYDCPYILEGTVRQRSQDPRSRSRSRSDPLDLDLDRIYFFGLDLDRFWISIFSHDWIWIGSGSEYLLDWIWIWIWIQIIRVRWVLLWFEMQNFLPRFARQLFVTLICGLVSKKRKFCGLASLGNLCDSRYSTLPFPISEKTPILVWLTRLKFLATPLTPFLACVQLLWLDQSVDE